MIQTGLEEDNELFVSLKELLKVKEFKNYLKNFTNPMRFLIKEEIEKILKNCNFKNIKVEPYLYKVKFKNENELINFFKAAPLVPYLTLIPEEMHEFLIEKFKEIFLQCK